MYNTSKFEVQLHWPLIGTPKDLKTRNTAPVRRFYEAIMISAVQNQDFSFIILMILKKRAKRLTIFDEIISFPAGKPIKAAWTHPTRKG